MVSIAYRLAPQNPFPAAILDVLMVWMNLVYPPKSARHSAVPPKSVVFAGDSAGGGLCLAVVQSILRMYAIHGHEILFNGENVEVSIGTRKPMVRHHADLRCRFRCQLG